MKWRERGTHRQTTRHVPTALDGANRRHRLRSARNAVVLSGERAGCEPDS